MATLQVFTDSRTLSDIIIGGTEIFGKRSVMVVFCETESYEKEKVTTNEKFTCP